jgi:hypothetical protein
MNCKDLLKVIQLIVRTILTDGPEEAHKEELVGCRPKGPSIKITVRIRSGSVLVAIDVFPSKNVIDREIQDLLR